MSEGYKAPTDWRALCEELADALACHYPGHVDDDELVNRARAALAEPAGEGPTDNELSDLLEQRQAAPVPVAVSKRLPGAEDCDAEGRCWLYRPQTPILNPYWDLAKLDYIDPVPPTHWLSADRLPMPA